MVGRKRESDNRKARRKVETETNRRIGPGHGRASIGYGLTGNFPLTIAAAHDIKSEQSLWNLGDALVKECGPPSLPGKQTGSDDKLKEAKKALEQAGFQYSVEHLRELPIRGTFPG